MRSRLAAVALVVAMLSAGCGGAPEPGREHPEALTPMLLTGERPVAGAFQATYRDYGEPICDRASRRCALDPVLAEAHRVSSGTMMTKLRTFVLAQQGGRYDHYLLVVNVALSSPRGSSDAASATFELHTTAPKGAVLDSDDSQPVTKDPDHCQNFPVTVGRHMALGQRIGAVRFCDGPAALTVSRRGGDAIYTANSLRNIRALSMGRIVKVKAGTHPRFTVTIKRPTDSCTTTNAAGDLCTGFRNATTTRVRKIGTGG